MKSKQIESVMRTGVGNVGFRTIGGTVPEVWRRHYHRLLQLRERIVNDANDLASESNEADTPFSIPPANAATDCFDRDLAFSLLSFERDALSDIDAALQRIRDGSYGVCELTGKLIPRKRLEAIPWARYTVEAQAEMESKGDATHTHLNKLESIEPERLELQ